MAGEYLLEVKDLYKSFGGVQALKNVSLTLRRREVLAVVGDNGAGKSTLMKVISGAILPDSGQIFLEGQEARIRNPQDALELGIQMTYQDLALVDCLDITTNLFLGREICRPVAGMKFLKLKKMRTDTRKHLESLGIKTVKNLREKVRRLSGGQRQVIAISRAVFWGQKIIILDEPTAALGVRESQRVLELIRALKEQDISVVVISHNLHHVFFVADRVMVLRHGENAGEREIHKTDGDEVVKLITGAEFIDRKMF